MISSWWKNPSVKCVSLRTWSCVELAELNMSSQLRLPKPLSHPWYCHVFTTVTLFCQECPSSSSTNFKRFKIVPPDSFSRPLKALTHASPLLVKLHWLPIAQRIEYKGVVVFPSMRYYIVSNSAPPYLSDLHHLYIRSSSLRPSADIRTFRNQKQKAKKKKKKKATHFPPIGALSHGINSPTRYVMLQ